MSNDDTHLADVLVDYYAAHDRVDALNVEGTKSLFGVRDLDDRVAELSETATAMRGDTDDTRTFRSGDTTVNVLVGAARIDIAIEPIDAGAWLITNDDAQVISLDAAGAATLTCEGPVQVRVVHPDRPDGGVITEPFVVPPRR